MGFHGEAHWWASHVFFLTRSLRSDEPLRAPLRVRGSFKGHSSIV